ncbi:MAG: DMT family transporter [Cohaesibacteraceae bacterium]
MLRTATLGDLTLLIVLAAMYGSAFSAIAVAVPAVGPFALVLCRVVIAFAILAPVCLGRGWLWPTSPTGWGQVVFLSLFNLLIPFFLVSWAQLTVNASLMALIMGAGPIFGLLIAHLATDDDRLTPAKALGVLLGFGGIALVLGGDAFSGKSDTGWRSYAAPAAALLASFFYAASGLLVRRTQALPPTQLATLVLGMGGLGLLLTLPFTWSGLTVALAAAKSGHWLAIGYLGVVTTGLAYILRYRLIRTVGMGYFGISIYLVPVFGIAVAALTLSEPLSPTLLIGLALVVGGLLIARVSPRAANTPPS